MNKHARWSGMPDANEKEIILELRDRGAIVVIIDRPLDLLVGYAGRWVLVEVKAGPNATMRKSQDDFLTRCWKHDLPVVVMDHLDDVDQFFPIALESTAAASVRP